MKLLAIGNSFSMDANTFLHPLAAAAGEDLDAWNLYIGGCSLERHWNNVLSDSRDYALQHNGDGNMTPGASLAETLAMGGWDVITLQQASHDSGKLCTYLPYLPQLTAWVKRQAPTAEIRVHQTWAYEKDSTHARFPDYGCDQRIMYEAVQSAYARAAEMIGAPLIPCGDAVQNARAEDPFVYENGGISLCRDGFHMSWLYGRYLLACVWTEALTGRDLREIAWLPTWEGRIAEAEPCAVLRRIAHETVCSRS